MLDPLAITKSINASVAAMSCALIFRLPRPISLCSRATGRHSDPVFEMLGGPIAFADALLERDYCEIKVGARPIYGKVQVKDDHAAGGCFRIDSFAPSSLSPCVLRIASVPAGAFRCTPADVSNHSLMNCSQTSKFRPAPIRAAFNFPA